MTNANGTITITMTLRNPIKLLCTDLYLVATVRQLCCCEFEIAEFACEQAEGLMVQQFGPATGTHTFLWTPVKDISAAERWDIQTKGAFR